MKFITLNYDALNSFFSGFYLSYHLVNFREVHKLAERHGEVLQLQKLANMHHLSIYEAARSFFGRSD